MGAAVDEWHGAVRHALAGTHFRQLALEPLAAHQVPVPRQRCGERWSETTAAQASHTLS